MIMRSQVLVLLQNQVFTDEQGRLLSGQMPSQRLQMQLDSQMRNFYRKRYTHRQALHLYTELGICAEVLPACRHPS